MPEGRDLHVRFAANRLRNQKVGPIGALATVRMNFYFSSKVPENGMDKKLTESGSVVII
jgi:hypothetical protein